MTHDAAPFSSRLAYAAAHVIMRDSYATIESCNQAQLLEFIDWGATMNFRRHLASLGFGIAEAMDTAQRFEIGWPAAKRLIEETGNLDAPVGFCAGASTDHLDAVRSTSDLIDGVCTQIEFIDLCGGNPVILPMPFLSINTCDARTYVEVYGEIIRQARGPIFIHWLGEMFLPSLRGYFPQDSFLRVMSCDPQRVRGAKISLLDARKEVELRRALAKNDQILLTGDDFNFTSLIAGGDDGSAFAPIAKMVQIGSRDVPFGDFSHALLGILDAVAAPASRAIEAVDRGDLESYFHIMRPLESLSRIIFEEPTRDYKVGLAFLSWLNGHQSNRMLVNHIERNRSVSHLHSVYEQAERAGVVAAPELASERITQIGV